MKFNEYFLLNYIKVSILILSENFLPTLKYNIIDFPITFFITTKVILLLLHIGFSTYISTHLIGDFIEGYREFEVQNLENTL